MKSTGTIKSTGVIQTSKGELYILPIRGTDKDGYPEVLIDATLVGGSGAYKRQSIKPFIGMEVVFTTNNGTHGYNYTIVKGKINKETRKKLS